MLKNGLIQGGFLVFQVLIRSFSVGWMMSALGQKRPPNIMSGKRLASGGEAVVRLGRGNAEIAF
jgi:hypothetical protein